MTSLTNIPGEANVGSNEALSEEALWLYTYQTAASYLKRMDGSAEPAELVRLTPSLLKDCGLFRIG